MTLAAQCFACLLCFATLVWSFMMRQQGLQQVWFRGTGRLAYALAGRMGINVNDVQLYVKRLPHISPSEKLPQVEVALCNTGGSGFLQLALLVVQPGTRELPDGVTPLQLTDRLMRYLATSIRGNQPLVHVNRRRRHPAPIRRRPVRVSPVQPHCAFALV